MAHPTYSAMRIRRHESSPPSSSSHRCHWSSKSVDKTTTVTRTPSKNTETVLMLRRRASSMHTVLRGSRKLGTKNNPYVGSFRHAPPTTFRSMEASAAVHLLVEAGGPTLPTTSSSSTSSSPPLAASMSSVLLSPAYSSSSSPVMSSSSSTTSTSSSSLPSFAMKSSPYVGFLRHAPPTTASASLWKHETKRREPTFQVHRVDPTLLSKLMDPCHVHPLAVRCWSGSVSASTSSDQNKDETAGAWSKRMRKISLQRSHQDNDVVVVPGSVTVDGRLAGGGEISGHGPSSSSSSSSSLRPASRTRTTTTKTRLSSSSEVLTDPTKTSAAVKLLVKLTSWLLYPISEEGEIDEDDNDQDDMNNMARTHGLKVLVGRPYDASHDDSCDSAEHDSEEEDVMSDDDDDDHDDDSSQGSDSSASLQASDLLDREGDDHHHRASQGSPTDDRSTSTALTMRRQSEFSEMNVSVSEVAESYYAHQLIDESNAHQHTQLDYVITQMDIARMARNASRHLDVDSILTLPTVIYRKPSCRSLSPLRGNGKELGTKSGRGGNNSHQTHIPVDASIYHGKDDAWSFVMVSRAKSSMMDGGGGGGTGTAGSTRPSPKSGTGEDQDHRDDNAQGKSGDDVCVICLDPFRDGDRLRVLPCDHSFHIGCIDRWLSGSHSHNECFTAGCPTCKKRPSFLPPSEVGASDSIHKTGSGSSLVDEEEMETSNMDGSVPSWAFAKLGSTLWQHD